ncbi:unnamed protein product [Rhodiola kirilowii]
MDNHTLLLVIILLVVTPSISACPPSDLSALLAFKSSLQEPSIGIFNTWTGTNCCDNWYGVSCNPDTQRVADINLRGESEDPILEKLGKTGYMTGSISSSVCKMDSLTTLVIADWKGISGSIPSCLSSLPKLRILDLIGNSLSGPIPSNIGTLSKLKVLNFADNRLNGQIPSSITQLQDLRHLDVSNNMLSGNIPQNLGNLHMLSRAL